MAIKLIVGLQNPGASYAHTRHNAGGWFVEALAKDNHLSFKSEAKLQSELCSLELNTNSAKLVLPSTYMNHSGTPVRAVSQFYRIHPDEILIVHDELDLPPGVIKLKTGGGHGGHNGLRDIIQQLGSSNFHRLRVGIGHPGHKDMVLNYVLGKPISSDKDAILQAIGRSIGVLPWVLEGNMAKAMTLLHSTTE